MTTDDRPALTPASQRSASYYRDMAQACHRSAAIERAQGTHIDPAERLAAAQKADRLDADAAQWDALADELDALDDQTGEHHEGQGALL